MEPAGPEKLELGEIECCALARAFAKNPEAGEMLKEVGEPALLKQSIDVLVRSARAAFPHNENVDLAYCQIAQAELKRLDNLTDDEKIEWEKHRREHPHSIDEHKMA